MLWIKRNLFFVLSIVVGLGLTGFCTYLFCGDLSDNADIDTEWASTTNDYNAIMEKNPFPSQENITKAKEDQQNVRAFLSDFNKVFTPFPAPPRVDEQGFKAYLEQTIFDLKKSADDAGVVCPDGFAFGFGDQQAKLNYPHENIQPWMEELSQIKVICGVLFQAKVYYLDTLMRAPVSQSDTGKETLQGVRIVTNGMQIITSYKIVFRGFSKEVASVLEGFAQSPFCMVVKNIDVRPAAGTSTPASRGAGGMLTPNGGSVTPLMPGGPASGSASSSSSITGPFVPPAQGGTTGPPGRGGRRGERGGAPGTPAATPPGVDPRRAIMEAQALRDKQLAAAAAGTTPTRKPATSATTGPGGAPMTMLSPHLLQVTLSLEAIKFKSDH